MNGSIEVNQQEIGNNEEEVLLGGIWYPWYSHEAKKQLKAAEIYASHFNQRTECEHIEIFGSCPLRWKRDKILKYIHQTRISKSRFQEIVSIKRTILLHDLYLWNDPELLDSFITQGVMLGGSH